MKVRLTSALTGVYVLVSADLGENIGPKILVVSKFCRYIFHVEIFLMLPLKYLPKKF